jgi:exodeoxyribonuclease-3
MKVISLNLNGIRSAAKKGVFAWLATQNADVICVQELKAQAADMTEALLSPMGYHGHFHYAQKKGYSGVGVYTRQAPQKVQIGFAATGFTHDEADTEGRLVVVEIAHPQWQTLKIASVYFPSGSSAPERQEAKYRFLTAIEPLLQAWRTEAVIVCGDVNIAHHEIDLKNWKGNLKNSGFLPEERAWMTQLIQDMGYVDVFRQLHPTTPAYTWWSNHGQARANNVGWRIDYQLATPMIAAAAQHASVYTEQSFSDHAPVIVDYV